MKNSISLSLIILFSVAALSQVTEIDPRYYTYDEVLSEIDSIAAANASICYVETVGVTGVDSLPIIAVKISDNASLDEDESAVLIVAGQHAREPAGTEVVMWLIEYLVTNYPANPIVRMWLDSLQIWFIPVDNPEGRQLVMMPGPMHTLHWRKNKRDNDLNGVFDTLFDGVDPNRNYPYRWSEFTDTNISSEYYKGPHPFSEPESRVVKELVERFRPAAVIDLHSPDSIGGNKLWFCWWDPDVGRYHMEGYPHYQQVGNGLARNTMTEITGTYYTCVASYNTKPKLQTWVYWETGACAILMEITNKCFWHGDTVDTIAARVGRGLFYIFDRMLVQGLVVHAFDSWAGMPLRAQVIINGVTDTTFPPRLCDRHGRYHRFLAVGTYDITVRYNYRQRIFPGVPIVSTMNTYLSVDFPGAYVAESAEETHGATMDVRSGKIHFFVPEPAVLKIIDISGREILRKRVSGYGQVGIPPVKSGVYIAFVFLNDNVIAKKFVVVK